MTDLSKVKKGDTVKFTEYEDEPESGIVLEEGTLCEVHSIEEDADGLTFLVLVDNPDFDSAKKKTKNNTEKLEVELFDTEVEVVKAPKKTTRSTKKKPLKTTTKPKTPVKEKAVDKPADKKTTARPKKDVDKEIAESKEADYEPIWGQLKTEDKEVVAIVEEQGENLIDYTKGLVENRSSLSYQLGGMLFHIQLTGDYSTLSEDYEGGSGGFTKFVEEHLGMEYRSAKYLVDIYTTFNVYGLGHKVAQIGWSKCTKIVEAVRKHEREMGKSMTKAEINKMITKASKSSVKELQEHIKDTYKTDNENKVKFKEITFSLPEERGEILLKLIDKAQKHFEVDTMGVAVENAMTEWATEFLED